MKGMIPIGSTRNTTFGRDAQTMKKQSSRAGLRTVKAAREALDCVLDVRYAAGEKQKLDVFPLW
jgi:hypothetical protein